MCRLKNPTVGYMITCRLSSCRNAVYNVHLLNITKTHIFKYIENFTSKNWKFSDKKNSDIFHISAQNIDCGYLLELSP